MRRIGCGCVSILSIITLAAVCVTTAMIALFLQTMFALTRETVVAEVIMYPIQSDNNGEYIEIDFTPYNYPTALGRIFDRETAPGPELPARGQTERYRLYGDVVAVRGPLIKLHTALQILGYENIYKLALIEGEYRRSGAAAGLQGSEAVINGGFDPFWWEANENEGMYPYNLVIDRVTFSGDEEPGFYGTGIKRYEIVVTMDTITWNYIGAQ